MPSRTVPQLQLQGTHITDTSPFAHALADRFSKDLRARLGRWRKPREMTLYILGEDTHICSDRLIRSECKYTRIAMPIADMSLCDMICDIIREVVQPIAKHYELPTHISVGLVVVAGYRIGDPEGTMDIPAIEIDFSR